MNKVVLSIGSNCSPRGERVGLAIDWINRILSNVRHSDIYETPEIHGIGSPYMNAVIIADTDMDYDRLHELTKDFELRSGRDETARRECRVPVDVDIVIWNDNVIRPNDYRQTFFRIGARMLGLSEE